jgi:hypothetical protein
MGNGKFTQTAPLGGGSGSGGGGGALGPWTVEFQTLIPSATANDGAPVSTGITYSPTKRYIPMATAGVGGLSAPFTIGIIGRTTPYHDPDGLYNTLTVVQLLDAVASPLDLGFVYYIEAGQVVGGVGGLGTLKTMAGLGGISSTMDIEWSTGLFSRQFLDNGGDDVLFFILSQTV